MEFIFIWAAALPASISEPRKVNWWDENEGKWVETDLTKEMLKLKGIPNDDKDVSYLLTFLFAARRFVLQKYLMLFVFAFLFRYLEISPRKLNPVLM